MANKRKRYNPVDYLPDKHNEVEKAGDKYLKAVSAGTDPAEAFRKGYDKVYNYISHTDFLRYISNITPKRRVGSTPAYLGGATPGVNPGTGKRHTITYAARKSSTGSGNYYPVVNDIPYYTCTYRTKTGAENEAKRMAQASKKELESGGYKVSVLKTAAKNVNCAPGSKRRACTRPLAKKNSNPPPGATKIYDNVLALEARKGRTSMWPGEEFRHDFKTIKGKASVYGLPDGSLLIKGNKRLWKKFNYPHGASN